MTVINTVRKIITNLTDRIENHENRVDLALMYKSMLKITWNLISRESLQNESREIRGISRK